MKKLYTVRDVKSCFGSQRPEVPSLLDMPNDDYALRVLKGCCAFGMEANVFNTYPEDKELWCIGEFDEVTGCITPCQPYLVGRAIDYIQRGADDGSDKSSEIAKKEN